MSGKLLLSILFSHASNVIWVLLWRKLLQIQWRKKSISMWKYVPTDFYAISYVRNTLHCAQKHSKLTEMIWFVKSIKQRWLIWNVLAFSAASAFHGGAINPRIHLIHVSFDTDMGSVGSNGQRIFGQGWIVCCTEIGGIGAVGRHNQHGQYFRWHSKSPKSCKLNDGESNGVRTLFPTFPIVFASFSTCKIKGEIPKIVPPKFVALPPTSGEDWTIKTVDRLKYEELFESLHPVDGLLPGNKVRSVLMDSKLPLDALSKIWDLADQDRDGSLDKHEFVVVSFNRWLSVCLSKDRKPSAYSNGFFLSTISVSRPCI